MITYNINSILNVIITCNTNNIDHTIITWPACTAVSVNIVWCKHSNGSESTQHFFLLSIVQIFLPLKHAEGYST